ncbi:MAG: M3 family metallopeptidase [Planctomycetes bacterium]|nr:M3 family metallopeptidase [Planctomycetota bacterium]
MSQRPHDPTPSGVQSPSANPLLGPLHALPRFDAILPEHVEPAISGLLAELERGLERLEAAVGPNWRGLVEPLERLVEPMRLAWGAVGHLMGVKNSPELRRAHEAVQPEVVRAFTRIGQSRPIYVAARALRDSPGWSSLGEAQRRIVDKLILDAELSGVGLDGAPKERFNEIQRELAELATRFGNHVLDATKAYALELRDPREVEGLPESLRQLAAKAARDAGSPDASAEHGPWRITLDATISGPFLQHSRRRDLREQVYRAWIARASTGELDNAPLIDRILALRDEKAKLLGFADYASLSLASKMARDAEEVSSLLEDLRRKALPAARRDHDELVAHARAQGAADVRHWDVAYWAERLRERRFAFTDEDLRPYFPLPKVLDGLFALAERLFDVRIVAADGETSVWHEDVRFFRILDADGSPRAAFYLDPYSRPAEKRGGAWMDDGLVRSRLFAAPGTGVRLPVAHLVCNGTPPVGERPSLMTFREVETLFHEFGHGLQHMLTTVDFESAAGINGVEWDAVELPSQFMENWCYHEPTLMGLSGHWQTGAPLPRELFDKLQAARTFRAGSDTLRQVYFASTDLALHHGYAPARDGSPFDVMRRVAERTTVLPPLPEDRFLCSFSHIFAGGYAAGYYSYKWAEVLSADAFGAFEDAGLDDPAAVRRTGRRFRDTVLALGGSRHPMDVFLEFRGRKPSTEALLRHSGLTSS